MSHNTGGIDPSSLGGLSGLESGGVAGDDLYSIADSSAGDGFDDLIAEGSSAGPKGGASGAAPLTFGHFIFTPDGVPTAVADTANVAENATASAIATSGVLSNDSDPDGYTLTVSAVAGIEANVGASVAGTYGHLTLNADGSYSYVADNTTAIDAAALHSHPVDTFSYTASDGHGGTASASLTFTIDRAPIAVPDTKLFGEGGSQTFAGNPVAGALSNDSDPDGDSISIIAVNGSSANVGVKIATTYGHVTFSSNGSGGYQADNLAAINATDGSSTEPVDVITYTISDGHGGTATSTYSVTIDRAPVTVADTANVQRGGTVSVTAAVGVLSNDSDPEGDTLSVALVNGATGNVGHSVAGTYGHLTLNADGSYAYTADNTAASDAVVGAHAVDTFTDVIFDNNKATSNSSVTFTIDRAPIATADTNTVVEGAATAAGANVLSNDSDPDNDALTVSAVNGSAGNVAASVAGTYGHLTLNADGSYSYAADNLSAMNAAPTGSHLTDSFTYTASDGFGGTVDSTLAITIDRTPTVAADSAALLEGATASALAAAGVLHNDSDPDGDTLTVSAVAGAAGNVGISTAGTYGHLTLNANGSYSYAADNTSAIDAAATGSHPVDTFAYTASDGLGGTTNSTLSFTIDRVAATATQSVGVLKGASVSGSGATGLFGTVTDPDGDTLTVTAVNGSANNVGHAVGTSYGYVTVNADGSYSYTSYSTITAPTGSHPTDQIAVTVSDGHGGTSTINLDMVIDRPPGSGAGNGSMAAGTTAQGNVEAVPDPDGDTITVTSVAGSAANVGQTIAGTYGHMTVNANGTYSYAADNAAAISAASSRPTDSFSVTVSDGHGGTGSVSLSFTIDRLPVVSTHSATAEVSQSTGSNLLSGDTDPDNDSLSVISLNGSGSNLNKSFAGTYGHIVVNSNGNYSYTADNTAAIVAVPHGQSVVDSFTVSVYDGHGGTVTETLNITVVNPPVAVADTAIAVVGATTTATAATGVLANDSDPQGETISIFAFIAGTDTNNATPTYPGGTLAGTYGHLTMNADGSYSYVADNAAGAPAHATDVFTYAIENTDSALALSTLTFTLDNAPTVAGDTANVLQGGTASGAAGAILANDTDSDGDTLTVSAVAGAAGNVGTSIAGTYGHLTLNADGSYSYVADNTAALSGAATGSKPVDSFAVTVSDGHGGTATETLSFTIDRAPIAVADTALVYEGGGRAESGGGRVGPLLNDSDPDGDSISIVAVNGSAANVGTAIATTYGHITLSANGSYSYSADNSAAIDGTDASSTRPVDVVTYTISDGHGGTTTTTDSFTIARAPVTVADTAGVLRAQTVSANAATGVLANDRDPDGNPFAVVEVNGLVANANHSVAGTYGHLTLNNDGSYVYTADNTAAIDAVVGAHAVDTFTYTVTDVGKALSTSSVSFTIDRAPTVAADTAELHAAATATADAHSGVLANDSDADGDTLTVSAVAGLAGNVGTSIAGTYGHLTLNADGSYSYEADNAAAINAAPSGTPTVDTFSYTASDGHGGTTGATLSFTIDHAATVVAANDAFTTTETTAIGSGLNLFANNGSGADSGSGLSVTKVNGADASVGTQITLASGALLTVNADGTFSYDPNHAFDSLAAPGSGATNTSATDSFTYTLNGGSTATATITVTGVDSNDTLHGTSGNDTFDGGTGTDTLVLTGSHSDYSFTYNATTHALTIADLRSGAPDGTDTAINVEQFQFSDGLAVYDASGHETSLTVHNPDGTTTQTVIDDTGTTPWSSQATVLDTQGSMASQTIVNVNGGKWVNTFDTTNASAELWDTKHYDASGNLLQQTVTNDDGTHSLSIYDVAGQYAWANATISYDANWNVTGVTGTNDNGTHTVTMANVAPALDTLLWFATPYDPNFGGAPVNTTLTGGANQDVLYGHGGNDTINGEAGNDLIVGGAGNDVLTGGGGNDTFVFTDGDGLDTITDFAASGGDKDVIDLHGYGVSSFAALQPFMSQVGSDTVISFDPDNQVTLHNVTMSQLNAGDFLFH